MAVLGLSRWPGLMPDNFSAVYGLIFCAGVYFAGRSAWWLPLGTLVATDLALNCYYQWGLGLDVFAPKALVYLAFNYAAYAALIWLGKRFRPSSSFLALLGGGILGAILFYLITNTASWFFNPFHNPEYTKTLTGWIIALTHGTHGWPETWHFFRNTLMSGGLFTGLFVGAMKLTESAEAGEEKEKSPSPDPVPEPEKADA